MAGKGKSEPSFFAKLYLMAYNLIQVFGWTYILYMLIEYYTTSATKVPLWTAIKLPVLIFQNAAILEIIHAITRLVPSNPITTVFQVMSRVMVVGPVLLLTPVTYGGSSPGLPMALLAWCITEIIRYFYYFLNLTGHLPRLIIWLRYSTFIILYPIGVTGELLCFYAAIRYAVEYPQALSYTLPNTWNFTFSFLYMLIINVLLYIPLFPHLYLYMFAQRRKMLGPDSAKVEKVK